MLHEVSRKLINVTKVEESSVKWHNSVLTTQCNKNLHLIDFAYNLQTLEKIIDLKECTISSSYDSPLPKNFLPSYAARGLTNLELVEMMSNPALWPHNKLLTQELTNIVAFQWSPPDLINNNESILATVNSVGNVELFASKNQIWYSLMDFSKEMKKYLKHAFDNLNKCSDFSETLKAVYSIETATICWCPELNSDNSCYFVTVQKNGDLLFWSLKLNVCNVQVKFCGSVENLNDFEIIHVVWIPIEQNKFLLVFTNELGQVMINECEIVDEKIVLNNQHTIWSYKDKMLVTYINYTIENGKLLLIFNKHRHIILQLYDKSLKLCSEIAKNINDYRITSITKKQNDFFISTVNVKVYKLIYSVVNESIDMNLELLEIRDTYNNFELHGIDFSNNHAILAIILLDRKLLFRKESLKFHIIFLCDESNLEGYAQKVIDNPLKKFTNKWDDLEILRSKIMKAKKLPKLDYNKLLKDGETDVHKMKIYLVMLILYNNLSKTFSSGILEPLPETSLEVIKDRILIDHAVKMIKLIYKNYEKQPEVSNFNKECFVGCKKYLNYYCKKYSKKIGDFISENILNIFSLDIEDVCQACDSKITEFSCPDGHPNMFCSYTFTLIQSDNYLTCKSCGVIARYELMERKPICVFCDLYLIDSS